jgi:hypothetical protein
VQCASAVADVQPLQAAAVPANQSMTSKHAV